MAIWAPPTDFRRSPMPDNQAAVSPSVVDLGRRDLIRMVRLMRVLDGLSRLPAYRRLVQPELPEIARFDPGHDAVMMGYDFHLTPTGPRLIEVNTNAGGALLAWLAYLPGTSLAQARLPKRLEAKVLQSFFLEWQAFGKDAGRTPRGIAIIDERPEEQFLFPEMRIFADLLSRQWGVPTVIGDPSELAADFRGISRGGGPIDLVYNRHCDFYLNQPEMAGIREAYEARAVCLTPNPFVYGLLADKRRMILWSDRQVLEGLGLDRAARDLMTEMVPASHLLSVLGREAAWRRRENLVFKPVSRFGGRGVLLGSKISRTRFDQLQPGETLVQDLVPPSLTHTGTGGPFKTDFRLFVYRKQVLGVAARLYQGQVTNLRTPGGGFAKIRLI